MAIRYLSVHLRADKDIVMVAVGQNADALRLASDDLKQDHDCWIAAKLWKRTMGTSKDLLNMTRIALSTRFSLTETSDSTATDFTYILHQDPYFQDGNFLVYSPNAFSKSTCDPNWTTMKWPCRGTQETCCMPEASLKQGKPTDKSCWRYSYRYHLQEAYRTNGFMIQLADFNAASQRHVLGNGQQIEYIMAKQVGTKIFRVCQPVISPLFASCYSGTSFQKEHIVELVKIIQEWYNHDCQDRNGLEIQFWFNEGAMMATAHSPDVEASDAVESLNSDKPQVCTRILDTTSDYALSTKVDVGDDPENLCPWATAAYY